VIKTGMVVFFGVPCKHKFSRCKSYLYCSCRFGVWSRQW